MDEMGEVEARLRAAHDAVRQHDGLQVQHASAQRQLDAAEAELAEAERAARLEAVDVEKLESFSGERVWSMLKGSRESDLDREKAEAEAARGKAAEAKARRDMLAWERDALRRRLDDLADADRQLAAAIAAKEDLLVRTDAPAASRLTELAEERGRLEAERRELAEVWEAGRSARALLDDLCAELGKASDWSAYDTFLGGGAISTAIKHDRMDRAARLSREADRALAVLRRELSDVGGGDIGESLVMSEGTRFMDMWFDNIFTDLNVRSQIHRASDKAHRLRHQVLEQVGDCQRRLAAIDPRLESIAAERRSLLV